jgi:hypothetical protein
MISQSGSRPELSAEVAPPWDAIRLPRDALGALRPFDSGGEGMVYQVKGLTGPYRRPALYKEYRPAALAALDEAALERFPTFARTLDPTTLAWLFGRAAWPAWIVDGPDSASGRDRVLGVVMTLAPPRFMIDLPRSSGGRRRVPAKFELLLNGKSFLDAVGIEISMREQIQLLLAVAETLAFVHSHSIAVGDFSCKNMLFSLRPSPAAFLIDCDSMSWGGRSALAPGQTPEWELPAGEPLATISADVYKFALLVLRMHTGAQHHRSAGRLPDTTWGPLRQLVERSLSGPPAERPLITEWTGPLRAAADVAPALPPPAVSAATTGRVPVRRYAPLVRHPIVPAAGSAVDPASSGSGRPQTDGTTPGLLPPGQVNDLVVAVLRRVLVRRPASPSPLKLAVMVVGVWVACACAFALAVLAGMDPRDMSTLQQVGLFGAFAVFALGAFALATTEPR